MAHDVTRRHLLGGIAATTLSSPALLGPGRTAGTLPPLPDVPTADAVLLRDGDTRFERYQKAFNARTILRPQLRAVCRTARSIGALVDWCRDHDLPFALRSGGHCFEGFSQSDSVVIDTRMLDQVAIDAATRTATVGAGASLGAVYLKAGAQGLALVAGSCPTIGVSGHVLGGGYGHLARPLGLASDNLIAVDLIDPEGRQIRADAQENSDLFWACRGGGGGSFGAATGYRLQLHAISDVLVFHMAWRHLSPDGAATIMADWQSWAPRAPDSINATLVVMRDPAGGGLRLQCSGQSIGSLGQLRRELKILSSSPTILPMSHLSAVKLLAGRDGFRYTSGQMKGKSDCVLAPLSHDVLATLMHEINARKTVSLICDPYGGAIARMAADATAFPYRAAAYCIEYISEWTDPTDTERRLQDMADVYAAMRPHVSGAAYVNYCDVDLTDWQRAYWGPNLGRLKQIKAAFDPGNVFRHAQSVPVG
ncbi:MAG: hypothetical protein QOD56_433 [Gammaproteobacteria bacterium]|nr:hypothetical protein [Gammaproteobacteria bacterium]